MTAVEQSEDTEMQYSEVKIGPLTVEVVKGGFYDRFRMNPDLDEVARDPAVGDIEFFRRIPKQQLESRLGPMWAPNFYYRSSMVQLGLLAPLSRLRAMLPIPLEPLRVFPGYGIVGLSFFSYAVCDNDPYNEASVAVIIRRPNARGSHALELLDSLRRRSLFAHVLALPVTTEIARMRGLLGYQLPKWNARIDVNIGADVRAYVASRAGNPDLTLHASTPALRKVPSQSHMASTTMVNQIDGRWHQTAMLSNTLSFAHRILPRGVQLTRQGGPLSQLLDGLGASKIFRFDVVKDAQLVLNLPIPIATAAMQY